MILNRNAPTLEASTCLHLCSNQQNVKQLSYLWPLIGREDPPWLRLFLFAVSILLTDLQGKKNTDRKFL